MVFLAAVVTAAELGAAGLLRLCWRGLPNPVLWLFLLQFGGMSAFILTILYAQKKSVAWWFLLVLAVLSALALALPVSRMFPLASSWVVCTLIDLLGGCFGLFTAACITVSGSSEKFSALAVSAE